LFLFCAVAFVLFLGYLRRRDEPINIQKQFFNSALDQYKNPKFFSNKSEQQQDTKLQAIKASRCHVGADFGKHRTRPGHTA
jgi:hypothetical protein